MLPEIIHNNSSATPLQKTCCNGNWSRKLNLMIHSFLLQSYQRNFTLVYSPTSVCFFQPSILFLSVFYLLVYAGVGFVTRFISNKLLFAVVVSLQFIPFLVLCLYLIYRLFKPCCTKPFAKIKQQESRPMMNNRMKTKLHLDHTT